MTLPHWTAHIRGTTPTTTGVVTASRAGVGSAPVGAMITAIGSPSDNVAWPGVTVSTGFVDSAGDTRMSNSWIRDNVGTSVSMVRSTPNNGQVLRIVDPATGTVIVEAEFNAWVTDGIELNFTTVNAVSFLIEIVLIFGSDTETSVFKGRGPSGGSTTITTGFSTTYMFTAAYNGNGSDVDSGGAWFWNGVGRPSNIERSTVLLDNNGVGTMATRSGYWTARLNWNVRPFSTPVISASGTAVDNFTATGFDIVPIGPGVSQWICGLAVHAGDGAGGEVNVLTPSNTVPASTGLENQVPGWKPGFLYFMTSPQTGLNSLQNGGAAGLGFVDFNAADSVLSIGAQNGVGTSNANTQTASGVAIGQYDHTHTLLYAASITNRDATSFDINWVTVSSGRRYSYLVIEELPFSGSGAGTLPLATGTGVGVEKFTGSGAGTLPLATGTGTGSVKFSGSGAGTLPLAQGAGTAVLKFTGSSAGVLPLATAVGTGQLTHTGAGAAVLPLAEGSGVGRLRFIASGAGVLPLATGAGVAGTGTTGAGAGVLPLAQGAGSALLKFQGAGAGVLPLAEAAGSGALVQTGSGAALLPLAEGAGAGNLVFSASGAGVLPLATGTGTGVTGDVFSGTGAGVLPLAQGAGTAILRFAGAGAGVLPLPTATGVSFILFTGSGAGILPLAQGDGLGELIFTGAAAGALPLPTGAGAGTVTDPTFTGAGAGVLPLALGSGAALLKFIGAGAGVLPLATGLGFGINGDLNACFSKLLGQYCFSDGLLGRAQPTAALDGRANNTASLNGRATLSESLEGRYDNTSGLEGGGC